MFFHCPYLAFKLVSGLTYPGFTPPYGSGPDWACLLIAAQDFRDAAVRNPQLSGDDAGPDAMMRHLHDFVSDVVR